MPHPPAGCWSCGAVPSPEDVRLRAVLHPREASAGGPYSRMACPACGVEGILEVLPEGGAILAPPGAAGIGDPILAALLEGTTAREARRRARRWLDRWGEGFEAIRLLRRAAPPPADPGAGTGEKPPRSDRPPREDAPTPPPRRGRGPEEPLPRNREEARAVLGVTERAAREEIDAAFRAAARRCHPDLVAHLDRDFQRLAHDKFLRIRRAHEILTA